ncbi:putative peptide-methionine (S)-S-oxide reductase [Medicago truncatula]|uniref:peptide-methionine (S)-S-oxide reductase n=2 Tax=Medicago truncatula TaxID=3880 RepID=B7FJB1_MEDTR|nr:peptide methionine sulfoxide reductase A1 isoform X1 [Medicago truncatula]XP_024640185.1 peptide methionine sulfoxide reductase A1 isoform X1 [Medicago truncatula]ACJ84840.1 unknown [Medicago truncatula]AET00493.2 peptide methionine sulfoxide reductase family protein [Medicago truncatula]RHN57777.1 putative peptide-methionine (S)-S-oxide reductase [Medicago truncatula]
MRICGAAASSAYSTTSSSLLVFGSSSFSTPAKTKFLPSLSRFSVKHSCLFSPTRPHFTVTKPSMNLLNKLGFGSGRSSESMDSTIPQGPDDDIPAPGQQFAQFGAGCFWGVELVFQRVPGVSKTEVGYTQGLLHNPTYEDVCSGTTNHNEVVRVQYDPKQGTFENLLDTFWSKHDPTTPNRQGNDVGTQYRSGIYFYTPEQEKIAKESLEQQEKQLGRKIATEILPAKKFYRAEEYHQQYLEKGGRFGFKQSAAKGCNDPIRCYG